MIFMYGIEIPEQRVHAGASNCHPFEHPLHGWPKTLEPGKGRSQPQYVTNRTSLKCTCVVCRACLLFELTSSLLH